MNALEAHEELNKAEVRLAWLRKQQASHKLIAANRQVGEKARESHADQAEKSAFSMKTLVDRIKGLKQQMVGTEMKRL